MNETTPRIEHSPVVKSLVVHAPAHRAFDLFTGGIDRWWPRATHSISQERTKQVVFECRLGGSIHEISDEGTRFEWGRVLIWDPPHRAVFTWYPGRDADTAQQVEVRFETEGASTRVTLTHTGWEVLGEEAREIREGYDQGWETVFRKCYGEVFGSRLEGH